MGSLFYINVPNREHEIQLRQMEQHIVVVGAKDHHHDHDPRASLNTLDEGIIRNASSNQSAPPMSSNDVFGAKRGSSDFEKASIITEDRAPNSFMSMNSSSGVPSQASTLTNSDVDVYEGTAGPAGQKVDILVSQDTMEIKNKDGIMRAASPLGKSGSDREINEVQQAIDRTFLEKHLEESLKKFEIYDATWGTSIDGNFSQVSFTVNADRSEEIINYMLTLGIGLKYESTLSVCAAIVYYNEKHEQKEKKKKESGDSGDGGEHHGGFGSKFIASIKSRLTVAQVIQSVQNNAIMTFDFIVLIIVAGMIAGLGLLENSSVNLVASMLISPLMGPIMAGCFGAVIRDWKLVKIGVISELIGLSICLGVGFFFGICVGWHPFKGPWADVARWPTDEMTGRGKLRGTVVGVFVAIPSGAGVALSILGGNAGSLVGVAISASLLPPAVNAGLYWGMTTVIAIKEQAAGRDIYKEGCDGWMGVPGSTNYTVNHTTVYCTNVLMEFAYLGICSFGLTVVNIILILITGAIVLKIKEVAPHTTRKAMNRFWKEDLKAMRDYNIKHGGYNEEALLNEIDNADNSSQLKIRLANDKVFNQVTRRNVFGNSVNILDTSSAGGDSYDGPQFDIETGTRGPSKSPERRQSVAANEPASSGGGFFGWMFGGRKPVVDSELNSPEATSPSASNPQVGGGYPAAKKASTKTISKRI